MIQFYFLFTVYILIGCIIYGETFYFMSKDEEGQEELKRLKENINMQIELFGSVIIMRLFISLIYLVLSWPSLLFGEKSE